MIEAAEIYMGTVLLEKNRWTAKKTPSLKVSEWLERFKADGFDGIELWANHAGEAGEDELALLQASTLPVSIFNSYAAFTDAENAGRDESIQLARRLKSRRIKYNIGNDPVQRDRYMENLRTWRSALPDDVTLLCECHPGTLIEEAADARKFFDELGLDNHGIIVHPFSRFDSLAEWFETFGTSITHAHLQMRDDDDQIVRFDRFPQRAEQALRIMEDYGYRGSFALEFTEGAGLPDENIERLYENALYDLAFLKERLGM